MIIYNNKPTNTGDGHNLEFNERKLNRDTRKNIHEAKTSADQPLFIPRSRSREQASITKNN